MNAMHSSWEKSAALLMALVATVWYINERKDWMCFYNVLETVKHVKMTVLHDYVN